MSAKRRCVLFLQGSPSHFSRYFADELERRGARALRINFAPGDWIFWHDKRVTNYRGTLQEWPAFLREFVVREDVTDIIYYADRLPYHIAAGELALELGLQAVAYEFGYLRPDWMTFERIGMSTHSRFPEDPNHIRSAAKALTRPNMTVEYPYTFRDEAMGEVLFHISNVLLKPFYPLYDRDKYYHPISEYLHYLPKLLSKRRRHARAKRLIRRLAQDKRSYFLFPLQLQSDRQIQFNSRFVHLSQAIEEAIDSFTKHASPQDLLIFKVHPLDNWIEPWNRIVRGLAASYGMSGRVKVLDGGLLGEMMEASKGVVLVNSTAGISAIRMGVPVKVLGIAVFDIEGLACQKSLDEFWRSPTKPDLDLYADFEALLAATIQIKGNVFTKEGRAAAARAAADKLLDNQVNLPNALVEPPPRLARAKEHGIPVTLKEHLERRGRRNRWFHDPT